MMHKQEWLSQEVKADDDDRQDLAVLHAFNIYIQE
jgi:hypothetical protein